MRGQEYGLISKASVDEHGDIIITADNNYTLNTTHSSEDTHKYLVNHR